MISFKLLIIDVLYLKHRLICFISQQMHYKKSKVISIVLCKGNSQPARKPLSGLI